MVDEKRRSRIEKVMKWSLFIASFTIVLVILVAHLTFGLSIDGYSITLLILLIFLSLFPHSRIIEIPGILKVQKQVKNLKKDFDQKINNIQNTILSQSTVTRINNKIYVDREANERGIDLYKPPVNKAKVDGVIKSIDKEFPIEDADSVVALFKVRLFLENNIRKMLEKNRLHVAKKQSLGKMIRTASDRGIIKPHLYTSLMYISEICNRAVHGARLDESDAAKVLDLAKGVLTYLESEV